MHSIDAGIPKDRKCAALDESPAGVLNLWFGYALNGENGKIVFGKWVAKHSKWLCASNCETGRIETAQYSEDRTILPRMYASDSQINAIDKDQGWNRGLVAVGSMPDTSHPPAET